MTTKNFQYAMQDADTNGNLDIDEVVGFCWFSKGTSR